MRRLVVSATAHCKRSRSSGSEDDEMNLVAFGSADDDDSEAAKTR